MREIKLTNGMVAVVDDEDYERLAAFRWSATEGRRGDFYAVRMATVVGVDGSRKSVCRQMQRDVLDLEMKMPGSIMADHRNHDTLDNRRSNLRWLTANESALNRRLYLNNRSGYRGVHFCQANGKYRAQIGVRRRRFTTGYFATAELAAAAYNRLALQHHGKHARLNVIPNNGGSHGNGPTGHHA
ncbi:MAG: HNH endonuclease [Rhodopila sp.]